MEHKESVMAQRQQAEWNAQQALWDEALQSRDIDLAKLAKVMAECLRIRHEGERKALAATGAYGDNEDSAGVSVQWQ